MLKATKSSIRYAKIKDLPQIICLCKAHAEYEHTQYESGNKDDLLSGFLFGKSPFGKSPSVKCLVVEHNDSIIGYATFMKQFSTWDANFYVYIDCLFLKASARGKGFGTLIMEEIKKYAAYENCNLIQWQTPHSNKNAIGFYRKIGGVSKTKERFIMKC